MSTLGLAPAVSGYLVLMGADEETRSVEQEVAAGQSETTPVWAIGSVVVAMATLVVLALGLAIAAYLLT